MSEKNFSFPDSAAFTTRCDNDLLLTQMHWHRRSVWSRLLCYVGLRVQVVHRADWKW
jgi:hypothetical protein